MQSKESPDRTQRHPLLVTHDGRTIRYPDPVIKVNDTIQVEIATSKILDIIKFDSGNLCMITGGRNLGRVGTVVNRERHPGSFDIVHIKDAQGHTFATRYVCLIELFLYFYYGCFFIALLRFNRNFYHW